MSGNNNPAHTLMGLEMECGFAVLRKAGYALDHETALARFAEVLCRLEPHLPGVESAGVFLQNGGRFYTDCGHPEITTPECSSPQEAVRYKLAAEAILARAASALNRELAPHAEVLIFGNNFDYLSGTTWGCHESYLHRASPDLFPTHLVPHLVSRIIYTGSGGFASVGNRFGFLVSPRVAWLTAVISNESTHSRGILHTRDESLSSRGYRRAHIISGENNRSHLATYLKTGTTALVILMIQHGLEPANGFAFQDPLAAMRLFASDPECQAQVQAMSGQFLTALEVQWHYLKLAQANLERNYMPLWARALCEKWAETLSRLEQGPDAVKTDLDWAMKYDLLGRFARERGGQLEVLKTWGAEPEPVFDDPSLPDDVGALLQRLAGAREMLRQRTACVVED